ncbi:hypothetical protein [Winogradskyella sp. PE311]|uniref:phage head spike fiber domain-containing protein n=1 Tax=Winogradskyella sp. PE311 TaxID=3366943 RepID=UPI0039818074
MKKTALLLLVLTMLACKNEKKEESTESISEPVIIYDTIKTFTDQEIKAWTKTRVELERISDESAVNSFSLKRLSSTESCYLATGPFAVNYAYVYKVSVNVKKGANSNFFGLRLVGSYPDRVDAFFNLDKGELIETKTTRDFENAKADIKDLGNGWYTCSVEAEVAADNVRVILGPSSGSKNAIGWEGKTDKMDDVIIDPSSLTIFIQKEQ